MITQNEAKAIEGILGSDFIDGNHPVGKSVWSWSANTFSSARSFGGVVASLQKKGLVTVSDSGTEDACITLTQEGMDAYAAYMVAP